jgi:hypothetical protein
MKNHRLQKKISYKIMAMVARFPSMSPKYNTIARIWEPLATYSGYQRTLMAGDS